MGHFADVDMVSRPAPAPCTNRGAEIRSQAQARSIEGVPAGVMVGVDWLAVTFRPVIEDGSPGEAGKWHGDHVMKEAECELRERVHLAASVALGCDVGDWHQLEYGRHGYRQGLLGPGGARIEYDPPGRDDFHVSFPGKACALIPEGRLRQFLRTAERNHGSATRVDVKIDDFDRVVSIDQAGA